MLSPPTVARIREIVHAPKILAAGEEPVFLWGGKILLPNVTLRH